jgi:hypothetical protein
MTTTVPCKFTAPDKQPCPAFSDDRNRHGYCFAHHEIYLHDCAVAYRRRRRKNQDSAEQWARSQRLDVEQMNRLSDALKLGESIILVDVQ